MLLSAAPAALAQSKAAPAAGSPPGSHASPSGQAAAAAAVPSRIDANLNQLHTALQITPAEEKQWNAFTAVMRSNAHDFEAALMQRAKQLPSMNAVQDLRSNEKLAEAQVQRLHKLLPPFEALYNAMSPEQRQIADRVFRGAPRPPMPAPGRASPQPVPVPAPAPAAAPPPQQK
jgi:periplasmic protein CpxP/Spy